MFTRQRNRYPRWMVHQLVERGITDERVLSAFAEVPREHFVPTEHKRFALIDAPIPIGCHQTVSQPYVVALALQALQLTGTEKVLDVGTGSGWQAVLLSHLAREVCTIEIYQPLYTRARLEIETHAKAPVHTRMGDGSLGWPEAAPFDGIVAGCYATRPPPALIEQLAPGGRLVMPIGREFAQTLYRFRKRPDGSLEKSLLERVVFVPLLGEQGERRDPPDG